MNKHNWIGSVDKNKKSPIIKSDAEWPKKKDRHPTSEIICAEVEL